MGSLTVNKQKLKPFTITTKPIMEKYLGKVEADLSDYTFAANYIWLANSSGFYAIINKCFCLFIMTGGELTMLLPPLGKKKHIAQAIVKCFEIMNANNSSPYYSRIDYVQGSMLEEFLQNSDKAESMFEMLESYVIEKKLVDYIYEVNALIELRGNSYHTKRTEINKFIKSYPDYVIERLDSVRHKEEIVNLFNKWVSDRIKYMPKEEAEVFFTQLSPEGQALIKEFTAQKDEAKDLFNREVLKATYKIEGDIEGWVHHYIEGRPVAIPGGKRIKEAKAGTRFHREGSEDFVKDLHKTKELVANLE